METDVEHLKKIEMARIRRVGEKGELLDQEAVAQQALSEKEGKVHSSFPL